MSSQSSDPRQYLEEAARYRERAATLFDNPELRDSFLALARSYELLAHAAGTPTPSSEAERVED
jgi:hypothetical protein